MATFKFNPKVVAASPADLQFIDLLPEYLQTRENTKFYNTTIQQLFNIEQSETLAGYIGRKPGSYYNFATNNYITELTPDRQNYQLEPTMVSEDSTGDIYSTFFYEDLIDCLKSQGAITTNHDRLFKQEYYSFSPLIDLDKFTNYSNYYWSVLGSTTLVQQETFTNLNINLITNSINIPGYGYKDGTIVNFIGTNSNPGGLVNGNSYQIVAIDENNFQFSGVTLTSTGLGTFTIQPQTNSTSLEGVAFSLLPNGTPLSNGMRIVFTNDALIERNNVPFIVEGVGSSIILINDSAFDTQTSTSQAIPDYITIQRGSIDGNPWSIRNRWFHKDLIQNIDQTTSTLIQAHRPIIEFFKDMQLYNFGSYARQNVNLVYSLGNIQSLTGQPAGTEVDGVRLVDNDRILVINDQDPERSNRIFKVYGISNANAISLSIESDGESKFGDPVVGETVYVTSGNVYGGETLYYNGTTWIEGQQKKLYNQAPLYQLYDDNGISLNDPVEYPHSSFAGSTLFQYDTSTAYPVDPILGLNVVTDSFGAPEFTNTLETQVYTYLSNFLTTNINGYYFISLNGQFLNHWHKAPYDSKQYMLDQFIVGPQTNIAPSFTVKAATSGNNIPGFNVGVGPNGIGDQIVGVNLASGIIDSITSWSIGDQILIKDQTNASQNGIYEYVGVLETYATLIRPATFDKTSQVPFDTVVAVQQGGTNANLNFVMIQTETLDWEYIPMIWTVQTQSYGLQRTYSLSQIPALVAEYEVDTISTLNVPGFIPGPGPFGVGDSISGINLPNTFDSSISYYYGITILLKDQTLGFQNGIYVFSSGTPSNATITRAGNYNKAPEVANGNTVLVVSGKYINYLYQLQQPSVINWLSTPLIFNKIPKPEDNFIVELNGTILVNNHDFDIISGNVLNLSLTLDIKQDDLLQVWTYSTSGPVANASGFYEIPLNLEANANNDYVTTARFDDLRTHFATIIQNQLDFTGNSIGDNNYRDLIQNLGLGTGILQHSAPMLKLMMVNSLASTNVSTAMQYVEGEYARFYNKFFNKIQQLKTQGYTESTSYENWVLAALAQINVGKNSTFPFASNNVGGGVYYIPPSPAFLGITPVYRPQKFIDYTAITPLRVIRLHDGQLFPAFDNPITSPDSNNNQIIISTGATSYGLNYNLVYSWEIIVEANNSALIPEVDYTVKTGSVLPNLVLLNPLPAGTSIFVEWSNNVLDEVLLYLENMIYDSIYSGFKQNSTNLKDGMVNYSYLQERPGYFRTTDFSREEWNQISQLDFNNWVSVNKVSLDTTSIYDETNPFTWNYSNILDPNGNNLPGCWRGIYFYFYDTDRPHTNPWEMMGFFEKPYWWNSVYGPAPYTSQNFALWTDIQNGTIKQGARTGTYSYLARPGIMNYIPVDASGNLLDPITIGIATSAPLPPISSSVEQDYMLYANAPFVFGDLGPVEYKWKSSPNYPYGLAETMYLVKPPKFIEYFWEANNFVRIFPLQLENQFIINDPIAGIDIRPANSQTVIYTENPADVLIGIQQNIVDFLISTGQSASFLGVRIRGANAHLAYRASGFIDATNMTASVDSFGDITINNTTLNVIPPNSLIIPEDNLSADSLLIPASDIRVNLHTSSAIQEISYSALLFKNNNGYYEISGYDFSNQYFLYYKPIKTSSSISINVGGREPTLTPWASGIIYSVGTYVTYNNQVYRSITQNQSGVNFIADSNYWLLVQSVPLIGGINVLKYSQYETIATVLPYNTRFFSPQEIADFVYGYENYLQTQGWAFETQNSDGTVQDFSYMLQQILTWINSNSSQDIIIASPMASLATFTSTLGYVDNLQNNISGMPTVIDRLGFTIPLDKLTVTRFGNQFTVQPVASNTDQQIYGLKLNVVVVEHIVVFNDSTDFNDLIYDPLLDIRQERIYLNVTRAENWNGQFSAPGFLIQNTGLSSNFDKSVNDFTKFYDPNTEITASNIGLAAKALFGFQKSQALTNLLMDEQEQFRFYQGFLREKGTAPAFNKILRSSYVSDLNVVDFYEEWLVRLGTYGSTTAESIIEIGFIQDDIRNNPQILEFTPTNYQDTSSNVIQIGPNDPRYLFKNYDNLTVNQFETSYITPSLPTAGYALLTEASLLVPTYADLPAYVSTYLQTNTFSNAERIWIAIDKDGYDWGMYRIDTATNILSITQASSTSPFVVTVTTNPGLTNEPVIFQNSEIAANNGLYFASNITNEPLVGTIEAPAGVAGNLIINGITVNINSSDSLDTMVTEINAAAITNITASDSNEYLSLENTIGSTITIAGDQAVLTALGLTAGIFGTTMFDVVDMNGNAVTTLQVETDTSPYPQILRLQNIRFETSANTILGTVQYPILTAATPSVNINGTVVTFSVGDNISAIVAAINAALIPDVTASNFFGKLQLSNSTDANIILIPRYLPELGIESTTPVSGWDLVNDLWFFDNFNNTGYWAVTLPYNSASTPPITVVRQQQQQPNISGIKFVALMDGLTDIKLLDLNLFDPYQGVLPRNVEQEIDFKIDIDPAVYNSGTNIAAQDPGLAWVDDQVGRVWWDLSQVRYLDYSNQGNLLYQYNNWGTLFPGTSIAIYEWVESPVTPDNWTAYVTTGEGVDLYSATSLPKYTDRYVTYQRYDPLQGAVVPVYYFWLGGNSLIPQVDFRTMDVVSIELIITNPTSQGVAWFAPISSTTCLVSGVEQLLTDTTLLQIAFNNYQTKNKRHTHWTLLRENETIMPPASEIWEKMKDSLVTFVKITETLANLESNGISSEMFASLQTEGNAISVPSTSSEQLYSVYLPVPDLNLSERQAYGNLYRPRQSWFNDPITARQKFVQLANSLMNQTNWIDANPNWDENISLQAELFETPDYTVASLAEMYALLTTPNFNSGSTVYVTSDVTHSGNWSFWQYNALTTPQFTLLQVQTYNTNLYWSRVDWYATGYSKSIITGQNVLVFATLPARDSYAGTFAVDQIVYISDNGDGTWAAYKYGGLINNVAVWTLIAHQEATINFSKNLYDFSTVSAANLAFYEHAASEAMINIIDGFYSNLSTVQNQNQVAVGMIREAYRQNVSLDWVFKSSYVSAVGLEEPLIQDFLYQPDPSDNIFNFLNTTKPFHTKFRGLIEKKTTSDDSTNMKVTDSWQEKIIMKFDAVSVEPNQTLIQNILNLPNVTTAEKQYRLSQMSEKFTAAERIAVFLNDDPANVLPGSMYRGVDIDGVNFNDFSTLFGIKPGYDNSPYDGILGYDFDQTSPINLYDVFINGKTFNTGTNNSSDIIIDGDKFKQPYLAQGRPAQLAQLQVGDTLSLSVYTQNQPDVSGYDVTYYDTTGYDEPTPSATVFLGYRLFKNISNQWEYLRISDANSTTLTQTLTPYDTEIFVADATVLSQPDIQNRIPGVIFIGGIDPITGEPQDQERIIFWKVSGNTLQQILRGTSGTPWGQTYEISTVVRDAGANQVVPLQQMIWVPTPEGASYGTDILSEFLQEGQGSYNFS